MGGEDSKVIRARVALLDSRKLNVGMTAFVSIRTNEHNLEWLEAFAAAVRETPDWWSLYHMSGETDYLLRVVVPNIELTIASTKS